MCPWDGMVACADNSQAQNRYTKRQTPTLKAFSSQGPM